MIFMIKRFDYPVKLSKQKEGGYLIQFPDFQEAISQSDGIISAIIEASDCLEEAIANRIIMRLPIPKPSKAKRGQRVISLKGVIAAKAALYIAIKEKKITNTALAKKLNWDEKEVRRVLDPHYQSGFPKIEVALNAVGQRLSISIAQL